MARPGLTWCVDILVTGKTMDCGYSWNLILIVLKRKEKFMSFEKSTFTVEKMKPKSCWEHNVVPTDLCTVCPDGHPQNYRGMVLDHSAHWISISCNIFLQGSFRCTYSPRRGCKFSYTIIFIRWIFPLIFSIFSFANSIIFVWLIFLNIFIKFNIYLRLNIFIRFEIRARFNL